ncbi:hypothetical protein LU604_17890 [Erwinia tracheiphila]|uniref:Uncharacterized protein n=1 Tax=Erwinia tracheiphila TaxID=65700 RepID=A0A345CNN5_9GAMM|nr:hypothetical protein [Erwinia tracheiphila]AXF75052.1 hypothetical protein AV903_01305 [Erwinia tracheiphila]UIA82406.1 hypothetical protein LU604_17890 [Erwinia tracheiphila]
MSSFPVLATAFREQIAKEWSIRCELSPAMAIKQIVDEAVRVRLLSEPRTLPGNTFTDWVKTGKSPAWAAQSILYLLLKSGWIPQTESEWAGVAAILIRTGESLPVAGYLELLGCLSPKLDRLRAAGWIHAALLDQKLFVYEKTRKMLRSSKSCTSEC